ncbi:hypothetical protein BCU68_12545 [Vibrio sp. 10N.286.49.B3]|uniref:hypothetical protein n=1 Tax=Vibrio sp. 10N.286.49.B3 TaxID=1880855 RepID=UPI000C84C42B|nr:hypothetical protein [Vibrio sp. 10N.286.49.B3]PMH44355.1 hypothetical protein BCU68_12545 [Vibrio sp. 10N.286.49.B3]
MIIKGMAFEHFLDSLEELAYFDYELNKEKDTQFVYDFLQYVSFLIDQDEDIDEDEKEEIKERFEKYDFW